MAKRRGMSDPRVYRNCQYPNLDYLSPPRGVLRYPKQSSVRFGALYFVGASGSDSWQSGLMIKSFCAIFLLFSVSSLLHAQAVPAAERKGDLTVGAGLVLSDPDYAPHNKVGYSLFGDYVFL